MTNDGNQRRATRINYEQPVATCAFRITCSLKTNPQWHRTIHNNLEQHTSIANDYCTRGGFVIIQPTQFRIGLLATAPGVRAISIFVDKFLLRGISILVWVRELARRTNASTNSWVSNEYWDKITLRRSPLHTFLWSASSDFQHKSYSQPNANELVIIRHLLLSTRVSIPLTIWMVDTVQMGVTALCCCGVGMPDQR